MQVRPLKGKANRLYLTDGEYQLVLDHFIPALDDYYQRVNDHERFKRGTRMMAEAGFRHKGIDELTFGEYYTPHDARVKITFMTLHSGKDTTGEYEDGKRRDPWIRQDLKDVIDEHVEERGISEGDKLFVFSYSQLRKRIKVVGEYLAELTGNEDWMDLRPHDFRAYFANSLAEAGVSDEVIMWLGGWDDESTYYDLYKSPFLSHEIQTELALAGMLDVDVEVPDEKRPVEERIIDRLDELHSLLQKLQ